jgi:peptidyl-prolyl cis-trans isomerase C
MTRVPVILLGVAAVAAVVALQGGCKQPESEGAPRPGAPGAPGGPTAPAGPPQTSEELKTPLAKVDDVTITLAEFQERINRQSPYVRQRYTSLEQKREFLDSLVRFEILAKEAFRRGLDKDPEVVRTMKQVMIQKLMREEFDAKLTADSVPEAEIRAYYDANLAEYQRPEEVRVSAIILKHKAQAERVALEARGEAGKTNKGFRDLVLRYTADEDTKLRGGDLRYFSAAAKELPAPVVKAAFALVNTGDVSGAIDAGNGSFYVLKQTGRRRAMTKSYEDAKAQIRNKLFRDRRLAAQKEFVDAARAKAKIQINEASLAKVRVDTSNAPGDEGRDPMPPLPGTPAEATAPGAPTEPPAPGAPVPAPAPPHAPGATAPAPAGNP